MLSVLTWGVLDSHYTFTGFHIWAKRRDVQLKWVIILQAPGRSTEIGHDTGMSQTQAPGRPTEIGHDTGMSQTQAPGRPTEIRLNIYIYI